MSNQQYMVNTNFNSTKEISNKIEKLIQIEEDLIREKTSFNITRLLVLKSLCKDYKAKCHFGRYLTEITFTNEKLKKGKKNDQELFRKPLEIMNEILEDKDDRKEFKISKKAKDNLYDELMKLRTLQSQGRRGPFGAWIRYINNWNLLILENGIECFLQKEDLKIGYEIARSYVQKYDSRYGTGLIPASLPFLKNVTIFWKEYYKDLLSNIEKPKRIARKKSEKKKM